MALQKRRNTPAGSPSRPPSHHHHAVVLDCHPRSHSSLKCVLFVTVIALLLLIFAVSQRHEAAASCRLCLRGDGTVCEYRDGDGGSQRLVHADEDDDDDESDDEMSLASHPQICPRLYHEKQISRLDLMHALNNLMQGKDRLSRQEMDEIAERHVSKDSSFDNHHHAENYDAQLLQGAAASRGKTVYFFDTVERLKGEIGLLEGRGDRLLGFLVHLKRHLWIAIRLYQGLWYNFDSTKAAPLLFCDGAPSVHTFLRKVVNDGGLVVAVLKPRPMNPIMLAEKPPPSWTDIEYWKYWLFG